VGVLCKMCNLIRASFRAFGMVSFSSSRFWVVTRRRMVRRGRFGTDVERVSLLFAHVGCLNTETICCPEISVTNQPTKRPTAQKSEIST
jgi:hypothetical protein